MIVGLTGGIGSGKSTVSKMFQDLGAPVYNSDDEAKRIMATSDDVRKAIIALLGDKAYEGKNVNRNFIAQKVFGDKGLLVRLNAIVHPAVREHFAAWSALQEYPYVIQETALIFENGIQKNYDLVLLVTAPVELRIQRVIARDGTTRAKILARMAHQLPDTEKIKLADIVIENIDMMTTSKKVFQIHERLMAQTLET